MLGLPGGCRAGGELAAVWGTSGWTSVELLDFQKVHLDVGGDWKATWVSFGSNVCALMVLPSGQSMCRGNVNKGTCQHL